MFLCPQIPNKDDVSNIKEVLVDEEAVGTINSPGCGANILYRDDGASLGGQARNVCL